MKTIRLGLLTLMLFGFGLSASQANFFRPLWPTYKTVDRDVTLHYRIVKKQKISSIHLQNRTLWINGREHRKVTLTKAEDQQFRRILSALCQQAMGNERTNKDSFVVIDARDQDRTFKCRDNGLSRAATQLIAQLEDIYKQAAMETFRKAS
ncbi:MAG: hypothetical protein AAF492_15470 [Verrucomicrobiota bacterium]